MNAIAAIGLTGELGKDNQLLFHIKEDMERFKMLTENKVVVMGRATQESLPGGKPLKNRKNIVLSRNMDYHPEGFEVVHSIEEVFDTVSQYNPDDVFIIGGEKIYNIFLPYCRKLYLTRVHKKRLDADKYFPRLRLDKWKMINSDFREKDKKSGLEYSFEDYVNISE